jgi:hypothetical protein
MAQSAQNRGAAAGASLKQVQAFQQAVEDHRFRSEYVANVQQSTALFEEPPPHRRIAAMKAFLAEHVIWHVAFEEKHVFPQLPASERAMATRQAVLELAGERKAMKVDVSRLRRTMRNVRASGTAQAVVRLEDSFRGFLVVRQAHAVEEDNTLLSVKQSRRRAVPLR